MRLMCGLAVALLLCGCGGRDAGTDTGDAAPPAAAARPEVIRDTVMIEGMPEVTTARLVRGTHADMPFSTYVPDGLVTDVLSTGDSGAVRFTAAFGGTPDPNAWMHVLMYPPGTSGVVAQQVVGGFLRSLRPYDDPTGDAPEPEVYDQVEPPAWGVDAFSFNYTEAGVRHVGRIVIGRHGTRYFHVLTHYPAEYGDGLGPAFARILEHWRWEDTGTGLGATASPG